MNAATGERAQEHGERGHESLTLAGGHFGDFAFIEDLAADHLHIVVNHVPGDFVAAGHPVVAVDSLVAVDGHKVVAASGQVSVQFGSRDDDFGIVGETACGVAHCRKGHRQMLVEFLLQYFLDFLFKMVNLVPKGLTLVQRQGLDLLFQFGNPQFLGRDCGMDVITDAGNGVAQLVVGHGFEFRSQGIDVFIDIIQIMLAVALSL